MVLPALRLGPSGPQAPNQGLTPPVDPGDDGKVAIALAGDLVYQFARDANVDIAAAIAGTKIDPDFGAQRVATTGSYRHGAVPATTGDFRVDHGFTMAGANSTHTADVQWLDWGSSTPDRVTLGSLATAVTISTSSSGLTVAPSGANRFIVAPSAITLNSTTALWSTSCQSHLHTGTINFALGGGNVSGTPGSTWHKGPGKSAGVGNGGLALFTGGRSFGGGLPGPARIGLNNDDLLASQPAQTMIEVAEVVAGRRAVYLCLRAAAAAANLPNAADGVIVIGNAATAPVLPAVGGPLLFGAAGALKAIGTAGTTATLVAAEPHCPECGFDFVLEWSNPRWGHLAVCVPCLVDKLGIDAFIDTRRRNHAVG